RRGSRREARRRRDRPGDIRDALREATGEGHVSPGAEKGKGRGGSSGAFTEADEHAMREAIELARQGIEGVSPNPLVGAVVVRRGRVVGRGFHRRYGGPHAEVEAIRDAGEAAQIGRAAGRGGGG